MITDYRTAAWGLITQIALIEENHSGPRQTIDWDVRLWIPRDHRLLRRAPDSWDRLNLKLSETWLNLCLADMTLKCLCWSLYQFQEFAFWTWFAIHKLYFQSFPTQSMKQWLLKTTLDCSKIKLTFYLIITWSDMIVGDLTNAAEVSVNLIFATPILWTIHRNLPPSNKNKTSKYT